MHVKPTRRVSAHTTRSAGFTLIEVMVTLVVLSIGLLGVSKLQAASMANTQVSRIRSLLALQAGSLAAAMHANPEYWAKGLAPATFSVAGAVVTDSTSVLNAAPPTGSCAGTGTACTPPQIAALDVQAWAANLNAHLPTYSGTVTCSTSVPIGCHITLTWAEKYVATNKNSAQGTQTGTPTFTMFVGP